MATIRNRGEYQWEAQIRRKGYPAQRKTFETKADAQAWARMIESEIDRGIFVSRVEAERTAFHQLIDRYIWLMVADRTRRFSSTCSSSLSTMS